MPTITEFDVARYILSKMGEMSAMKLQKLIYYSQAWSMVWDEQALFDTDFEAWANGPVLPSIFNVHRGMFKVTEDMFQQGNAEHIHEEAADTIDEVLKVYGSKTAQWLSNLTHEEAPWNEARGNIPPTQSSSAVIEKGHIHRYYSGL